MLKSKWILLVNGECCCLLFAAFIFFVARIEHGMNLPSQARTILLLNNHVGLAYAFVVVLCLAGLVAAAVKSDTWLFVWGITTGLVTLVVAINIVILAQVGAFEWLHVVPMGVERPDFSIT